MVGSVFLSPVLLVLPTFFSAFMLFLIPLALITMTLKDGEAIWEQDYKWAQEWAVSRHILSPKLELQIGREKHRSHSVPAQVSCASCKVSGEKEGTAEVEKLVCKGGKGGEPHCRFRSDAYSFVCLWQLCCCKQSWSKKQSEHVAPLCCQMVAYSFSSIWKSGQAYNAVPSVKWQGGASLHLDISKVK